MVTGGASPTDFHCPVAWLLMCELTIPHFKLTWALRGV